MMRQRLLTVSNNNQDEFILRNMFRKFDSDRSGEVCMRELAGLLASLSITIEDHELKALFKYIDRDGSGKIEFDEFCYFMTGTYQ